MSPECNIQPKHLVHHSHLPWDPTVPMPISLPFPSTSALTPVPPSLFSFLFVRRLNGVPTVASTGAKTGESNILLSISLRSSIPRKFLATGVLVSGR